MATAIVGVGTLTGAIAVEAAEEAELVDVIEEDADPEVPRGRPANIILSIETIIISALIFIAILAWFEFIRSWFDNVFDDEVVHNISAIFHRLWYAIFITVLALILIYIVYRLFNPCEDPLA